MNADGIRKNVDALVLEMNQAIVMVITGHPEEANKHLETTDLILLRLYAQLGHIHSKEIVL